jgi:hypothetical protein
MMPTKWQGGLRRRLTVSKQNVGSSHGPDRSGIDVAPTIKFCCVVGWHNVNLRSMNLQP